MPIEQIRNFLMIALAMVVFLIWQAWQEDYGPKPVVPTAASTSGVPQAPKTTADITADKVSTAAVQHADVPADPNQVVATKVAPAQGTIAAGPFVQVATDIFALGINLHGGGLEDLKLTAFDESQKHPDIPFTLLSNQPPNIFLIQSGLLGAKGAPNHRAVFTSEQTQYRLEPGQKQLVVPLMWKSEDGIEITKRYIFTRGKYDFRLEYVIHNNSSIVWPLRLYGQLQRAEVAAKGGLFRTYTYTGGVLSRPDKPYDKIKFSDMKDTNLDATYVGGWVAMIQHYFAGALVPEAKENNYYYSKALPNDRYVLGVMTPKKVIEPGQKRYVVFEDIYRPQRSGPDERFGPLPGKDGRLWMVVVYCRAYFLGIKGDLWCSWKLGICHYFTHHFNQTFILQTFRSQL